MRRIGVVSGLTVIVALAVAVVALARSSSTERLSPSGTLTSSSIYGLTPFGSVAASISLVAASGNGGVSVFTKPTGGWRSGTAAAQLEPFSGYSGGPVAIAGNDVFEGVGGADGPGSDYPGSAYVFAEPSTGWTGVVHQSADLLPVTAEDAFGSSVATAGNTVVIMGFDQAFVFIRPTGGWAGVVRPAATLAPSPGTSLGLVDAVAISGRTVVLLRSSLPSTKVASVYREPTHGWHGVLHPSATLETPVSTEPSSVAISGSTVVVGGTGATDGEQGTSALDIFTRPRKGWSGVLREHAQRWYDSDDESGRPPTALVTSGSAIFAISEEIGSGHTCPCSAWIYGASAPAAGWNGTSQLQPLATLADDDGYSLAQSGTTVLTGTGTGVHLFASHP
jgi:hypothetical protein